MSLQIALTLAVALFALSPADRPADALTLLKSISQRYAEANSYHIEVVEERSNSSEMSRSWQKSIMTAIVMPERRYRYEGVSGVGTSMLISDGKHEWEYVPARKAYTEQDLQRDGPDKKIIHAPEGVIARNARYVLPNLAQSAGNLKSASYLPDETIEVGGKKIDCYVVHVVGADFKTRTPWGSREFSFWIDKSRLVIVKKTEKYQPSVINPEAPWRAITSEALTTFPVVDLDAHEPDSSFEFVAPKDVVLVSDFAASDQGIAWLMGKLAPEIRFRGPDGKITTLSSLQGKPVFLDFWASWCGPCNSEIPDLLKLYANTSSKGLTWIGIDNDSNPNAAEKFAKEQAMPWPNYHDVDGSMGAAFMRHTLPLGVLLDAKGKIIFYKPGYQVNELRGAIATLGPELAAVVGTGQD